MEAGNLERATREAAAALPDDVVGFSVLGVGAGTSRLTLEEHRAVDVVLNGAFARGLKASGKVKHLAFMSAAGANPSASTTGSGAAGGARYNRVKGEAEEAVRQSGPEVVSVLRPAMIIGSQHTPWLLEKTLPLFSFITPGRYKSIRAEQIAQAMAVLGKEPPQASQVYHYPEMVALIESHLRRGSAPRAGAEEAAAPGGSGRVASTLSWLECVDDIPHRHKEPPRAQAGASGRKRGVGRGYACMSFGTGTGGGVAGSAGIARRPRGWWPPPGVGRW